MMIGTKLVLGLVLFVGLGVRGQGTGAGAGAAAQRPSLHELQQKFVDLRFGMFIHFNIPTFMDQDWADPDASPALFNPGKLDCRQWAAAARSAHMSYGCLTTKHHSGFC